MMAVIKVGCCGFPKGMKRYFEEFNIVEIQRTFYQLPANETAERWFELAPQGFEFTVKAWQGITHPANSPTYHRFRGRLKGNPDNYGFFKPTDEVFEAWFKTKRICSTLRAKYVLFQCPASFRPTDENIENIVAFFKEIKDSNFQFIWEPRGEEWQDEIVLEICRKCKLIHAVDPFQRMPVTGKIAYFRLHGSPPGKRRYYYTYTDKDLSYILDMCKQFDKAYCFFNNISMYQDSLRFISML